VDADDDDPAYDHARVFALCMNRVVDDADDADDATDDAGDATDDADEPPPAEDVAEIQAHDDANADETPPVARRVQRTTP